MTDTIYFTKSTDPNYLQVLVASQFLHLKIATEQINKKYEPLILVTAQGTLNQPNAILLYLSQGELSGSTQFDKLRVYQWFQFFNIELHPLLKEIHEQISKEKPLNRQKFEYSTKQLIKLLENINNHLKTRTCLVGDNITAADISLATHLQTSFKYVFAKQDQSSTNKHAKKYRIWPDGLVSFDRLVHFKVYWGKFNGVINRASKQLKIKKPSSPLLKLNQKY